MAVLEWLCDRAFTGFKVRFARVENGRVVEVKGALLVSGHCAGAIYRISYRAP